MSRPRALDATPCRPAPVLAAVSVGQPQELPWRGGTLRSAIVKRPVSGRVWVDRLNVAGDGQADRVGHGGEHRAVFVYQEESHRYWETFLGRRLEGPGQFGENFTVRGLSDDEVQIGDRYEIGSACFEVTQPRVTCAKVGVRLGEPRMAALLTGHGRPGFYFRVLVPGEVGAGDPIRLVHREAGAPTVRRTSDLLYSADHDRADLERALAVPALSEGWRTSFEALLQADGKAGNAGLAGPREVPAWSGFRPFRVAELSTPATDVHALTLDAADGGPVPCHRAGQFVAVRIPDTRPPDADGSEAGGVRSYSLSAPADGRRLRISVKRVGAFSARVHALRAGDVIELGAPRGGFVTDPDAAHPLALISAGIGVTPLLAILGELAGRRSRRPVLWVHVARDGASHAHRAEVSARLEQLPNARRHIHYSRPRPGERPGSDFDRAGRLSAAELIELGLDPNTEALVCGPDGFMSAMHDGLIAAGLAEAAIRREAFGAVTGSGRAPHRPAGTPGPGPLVTFARSGLEVPWGPAQDSLLELAEACDVPVAWSCRTGVCHRCESGLISGRVAYDPEPLDAPAPGQALLCCSRPDGPVTLDL